MAHRGAGGDARIGGSSATRRESVAQQAIAERVLEVLLVRVDDLVALDDKGYLDPDPGSALHLDDAAVRPLHVSAAPRLSLLAAIDHLSTVAIIIRAGQMPMMAMGSLLRSALENACNTIFLTTPDDRATRVALALRDAWREIGEKEDALRAIEPDSEFERERDESFVQRAAAAVPGLVEWSAVRRRPPTATARVKAAGPIVESFRERGRADTALLGLWRHLSGLIHGRQYAALQVLDRVELSYDSANDVAMTHMTFGATTLASILAVVLDVVDTAVHHYGVRARAFTRTLADAEFEASLRRRRNADDDGEA